MSLTGKNAQRLIDGLREWGFDGIIQIVGDDNDKNKESNKMVNKMADKEILKAKIEGYKKAQ